MEGIEPIKELFPRFRIIREPRELREGGMVPER
jgi:hypothetical protein